MDISNLFRCRYLSIFLILFITIGCGKFSRLSWKECFEQGKKIHYDTSIPSQKRFAEAEEVYREALKKLEKALAKESVKTKDMRELFNETENVLRNQAKYAELEPILKKKIDLYGKYIGENKVLTGDAHERLGHLYKKLKRNKEAAFEYRLAMNVYKINKRESAVEKMKNLIQTLNITED
jgi:tetratricopeptide (TPR) repeat protein